MLWQFLIEYYWFSSEDEVIQYNNNGGLILLNGFYATNLNIILQNNDEIMVGKRYLSS